MAAKKPLRAASTASRPIAGPALPNLNEPSGVKRAARPAASMASMVSNNRRVSGSAGSVVVPWPWTPTSCRASEDMGRSLAEVDAREHGHRSHTPECVSRRFRSRGQRHDLIERQPGALREEGLVLLLAELHGEGTPGSFVELPVDRCHRAATPLDKGVDGTVQVGRARGVEALSVGGGEMQEGVH